MLLVPFNGSPCCRALSKCHRVAQSYYFADNFRKGNDDSNALFQNTRSFLMSILLAHPEEKVGSLKPFRERCLVASLISFRFKCSAYSPLHFPQWWGYAKNSHFFGSKIHGELYTCLRGRYRQGWCIKTVNVLYIGIISRELGAEGEKENLCV